MVDRVQDIGGVARALGLVERFDDAAAKLALSARRRPRVDRAMYTLSMLGDDGRVWIAAAALEATRARSTRRFLHAVTWLAVGSAIVNGPIKMTARRPRPDPLTEHEHRLRIPTGTSFPSGHAASAATMAVILADGSPLWPVWTALAAGIGVSRVHVGVHHGSDVVAGWVTGAAFGLLALKVGPPPRALDGAQPA